jgi:hypothetical protein
MEMVEILEDDFEANFHKKPKGNKELQALKHSIQYQIMKIN